MRQMVIADAFSTDAVADLARFIFVTDIAGFGWAWEVRKLTRVDPRVGSPCLRCKEGS